MIWFCFHCGPCFLRPGLMPKSLLGRTAGDRRQRATANEHPRRAWRTGTGCGCRRASGCCRQDTSAADWIAQAQCATRLGDAGADGDAWKNRLIYGDKYRMRWPHPLAGDEDTPIARRGGSRLHRSAVRFEGGLPDQGVQLPGVEIEQRPTVVEQFAYSDTKATARRRTRRMIVPRLIPMWGAVARRGRSTCIWIGMWALRRFVLDEIFSEKKLRNENHLKRTTSHSTRQLRLGSRHDSFLLEEWSRNDSIRLPKYDEAVRRVYYRYVDDDAGIHVCRPIRCRSRSSQRRIRRPHIIETATLADIGCHDQTGSIR